MNTKDVIKSQYHASLEMLKQAIVKCPDAMWDGRDHRNRYWHIAYHALFYTHLYLQSSEETFIPWAKHREQANRMEGLPQPPDKEPEEASPYGKEEILAYWKLVRKEVDARVDSLSLEEASGFYWLPMDKMELQFYNIRHLQQHTGELCERLGREHGIDVDWIGMKR